MTQAQGWGEMDDDAPCDFRDPEYIGPKAAIAFARIAHGIAAEMQCGHATEAWNMVAAVQKDMAKRAGLASAYVPARLQGHQL